MKRCRRGREARSITKTHAAARRLRQAGDSQGERPVLVPTTAAPRTVVVTDIVPIPTPLASGYDAGFTEQVVAWAGTLQETVTVEEYPKNGVTTMSFIYDAVFPAVTVCEVIPWFATVKVAVRFRATEAEVEAV
jgi:hypothetical protein